MTDVRRREFIMLLGGAAAAWPLAGRAQQGERMRRIGVLMGLVASDLEAQSRVAAFEHVLQDLGWVKGRNIRIEYRWAGGGEDVLRNHAAELLAMAPDLILANSTPVTAALREQSQVVPIVFTQVTDPVGQGLVPNLAAVTIGDGDRTNVEIRKHPFQITIGTASPGGNALVEVTARDKGLRSRIAKIGHARELYGREVCRLIDDDLRAVQFMYRRERAIAALGKGAADTTVFEHGAARLEHRQQNNIHFKGIEIGRSKLCIAVPTIGLLPFTAVAAVASR